MVTVGDRPFLAWILRELCRFGIEEVVLLTGHLSEVIEAAVPSLLDRLPRPMRLTCVREPSPPEPAARWSMPGPISNHTSCCATGIPGSTATSCIF